MHDTDRHSLQPGTRDEVELALREEIFASIESDDECLDLQVLSDLADGSLRGASAGTVQRHVRVCPECAVLLAELRDVAAPVRALHSRYLGWFGVLRTVQGRLSGDDVVASAWREHLKRCERCLRRKNRFENLVRLASRPWRTALLQAPGFAAGLVVVFVLTVLLPVSFEPPEGGKKGPPVVDSPPKRGPEPPTGKRGPKGGKGGAAPRPDLDLAQLLAPSDAELGAAIAVWEQHVEKSPGDRAVWEKLLELYARQAENEMNANERRRWLDKLAAAEQRLRELGR